MNSKKVYGSMMLKFLERIGTRGITTIVSIIMARLLLPDEYGVLAIMLVFTKIADTIVQGGFGRALVQKKDPKPIDYSSILVFSIALSLLFYGIVFVSAPAIANYYEMSDLVLPFRVISLSIVFSSVNAILIARLEKRFAFLQILIFNMMSNIISGSIGILLAVFNYGIWALVAQQLVQGVVLMIILVINNRGLNICGFSFGTVKVLYRFGWKIMAANLLNTVYNDLRSLVIGKRYSADQLGYYDKGKQIPQICGTIISDTVKSVLLPTLAEYQTDLEKVHLFTRKIMEISAAIIFPLLFGFSAIAKEFTVFLLGSQWTDSVFFAQLYGIAYAFYAFGMINVQAFNALGRSDIFLKYDGAKKVIGILILIFTTVCFDNVNAIAIGGTLTFCITPLIYCYPNIHILNYTIREQLQDIVPPLAISTVMLLLLLAFDELLALPAVGKMGIQIVAGAVFYIGMLRVFMPQTFRSIAQILKGTMHNY